MQKKKLTTHQHCSSRAQAENQTSYQSNMPAEQINMLLPYVHALEHFAYLVRLEVRPTKGKNERRNYTHIILRNENSKANELC